MQKNQINYESQLCGKSRNDKQLKRNSNNTNKPSKHNQKNFRNN